KNFSEIAKTEGYQVQVGENIVPMQASFQDLSNPREIIRWAFDAKAGEVSEKVFELESQYVVARLRDVRTEGLLPLESVKKDIQPAVLIRAKAKQLKEKTDASLQGASGIAKVAEKLGKSPVKVENIVFANPIIPGVAQENRVVVTVFGLQPAALSKSIEGNQG